MLRSFLPPRVLLLGARGVPLPAVFLQVVQQRHCLQSRISLVFVGRLHLVHLREVRLEHLLAGFLHLFLVRGRVRPLQAGRRDDEGLCERRETVARADGAALGDVLHTACQRFPPLHPDHRLAPVQLVRKQPVGGRVRIALRTDLVQSCDQVHFDLARWGPGSGQPESVLDFVGRRAVGPEQRGVTHEHVDGTQAEAIVRSDQGVAVQLTLLPVGKHAENHDGERWKRGVTLDPAPHLLPLLLDFIHQGIQFQSLREFERGVFGLLLRPAAEQAAALLLLLLLIFFLLSARCGDGRVGRRAVCR
mmetsp:Transcript_4933/g.12319  ORF Transcript_4933/g.12319 Transcript_4933/m.12319 type:complete len:304 (-) Transcript_4933:3341-4252(-)